MKFLMHWETRAGASVHDNLEALQEIYTIFGEWERFGDSVQVSEWFLDLSGASGWLVCVTDDDAELVNAMSKFTPWLTFTLTPVMDVEPAVAIAAASAEWTAGHL